MLLEVARKDSSTRHVLEVDTHAELVTGSEVVFQSNGQMYQGTYYPCDCGHCARFRINGYIYTFNDYKILGAIKKNKKRQRA